MKKPLVSIACITYNHAQFIQETLEGFLMQKTNFEFEILIHDDASTDGTTEIIKEFEKEYPDLIKPLYEKENQWVKGRRGSAVFNFPRAQGKYIAICEGDDYWIDPYKLQKQVDFLETNSDFSVCGTYCDIERYGKLERVEETPFLTFDLYDIISNNRIPTLTMMFKNNRINYNLLPQYPLGDVALLLELTKSGQKLAKLGFNSGVYRYHGQGANSGSSRFQNTKVQFETKLLFAKNIKDRKFYKKLKIYYFKTFMHELKKLFLHKNNFDYKILKLSFKYLFK